MPGRKPGVLSDNEVIEVYEHEERVRYVLLGEVEDRLLQVVVAQDDVIDATAVLMSRTKPTGGIRRPGFEPGRRIGDE